MYSIHNYLSNRESMSNFTETLDEFLQRNGGDFSADVVELFNQVPTFKFDDEESDTHITYKLRDMFVHDNKYKEIGAETGELFEHYLGALLDEVIVEDVPKLLVFMKKLNQDILNRYVDLKSTETISIKGNQQRNRTGNSQDTDYVNPASARAQDLTVSDVTSGTTTDNTDTDYTRSDTHTRNDQRLYTVVGKTNVELLNQLVELKNIYVLMLHRLDAVFLSIK